MKTPWTYSQPKQHPIGFSSEIRNSKGEFLTDVWGDTLKECECIAQIITDAPELKAKLEAIKTDADTVHRLMTLLSHGANVSPQSLERAEQFFKKLKTL